MYKNSRERHYRFKVIYHTKNNKYVEKYPGKRIDLNCYKFDSEIKNVFKK